MKKLILSAALCITLVSSVLTFLPSCSDGSDVTPKGETNSSDTEYSVDNTPTELAAAVNAALSISTDLASPDPAITMATFDSVSSYFDSFSVLTNASGMTQDEYGIFKVNSDGNVDTVQAAVKDYLADRLAMFTGDYTPEEKPKLENACVKTFGRFVVYCILSEEDTQTVMKTVEETLTASAVK